MCKKKNLQKQLFWVENHEKSGKKIFTCENFFFIWENPYFFYANAHIISIWKFWKKNFEKNFRQKTCLGWREKQTLPIMSSFWGKFFFGSKQKNFFRLLLKKFFENLGKSRKTSEKPANEAKLSQKFFLENFHIEIVWALV